MSWGLLLLSVASGLVIEAVFQTLKFLDDSEKEPPVPKYRPYNHYTSVQEFVSSGRRNWFRYLVFRGLPPLAVFVLLAALQQKHHIGTNVFMSLLIAATTSLILRDIYKLIAVAINRYTSVAEQMVRLSNIVLVYAMAVIIWQVSTNFDIGAVAPTLNGVADNLWSSLFVVFIVIFYNNAMRMPRYSSSQLEANKLANYVIENYRKIEDQFGSTIDEACKVEHCSKSLMYAILIYENMNRPKFLRIIENVFVRFPGNILTVGIAQVKSGRPLSDEQSIVRASQILKDSAKTVIDTLESYSQDFSDLVLIIRKYNVGADYEASIINILSVLRSFAPTLFRPNN